MGADGFEKTPALSFGLRDSAASRLAPSAPDHRDSPESPPHPVSMLDSECLNGMTATTITQASKKCKHFRHFSSNLRKIPAFLRKAPAQRRFLRAAPVRLHPVLSRRPPPSAVHSEGACSVRRSGLLHRQLRVTKTVAASAASELLSRPSAFPIGAQAVFSALTASPCPPACGRRSGPPH